MASSKDTEEISVVIVSDERSPERSWEDEFRIVQAFTHQVNVNIVEILLVENTRFKDTFPTQRFCEFPNFRAIFSAANTGSALKNIGIQEARGALIAMFEADTHPEPNCLQQLYQTLCEHPDAAACSPRTIYRGYEKSALCRCLSFLGRGQLEIQGYQREISNNAALVRTSVAKAVPYPDRESPFIGAAERNARLREAGYAFVFNRHALTVHEFEGFAFEAEYRRQKGFQKMQRLRVKLRRKIPRIVYRSSVTMWSSVRAVGSEQLRARDRPLAFVLCGMLPLLEIPGMLDAVKGKANTGVRFR